MTDYAGGTGIGYITSAGSSATDATPMPRLAQHSVYVVTPGGPGTGVLFPQTDAEIGDTLEIQSTWTVTATYYSYSGAVVANGAAGNQFGYRSSIFRYTSVGWVGFGQN